MPVAVIPIATVAATSVSPVVVLNGPGSLLLLLDFIGGELTPKALKLLGVPLQIKWMVHDEQVLLVARTRLECPVERACQQELVIHDHELVVHVELLLTVSAHGDASIGQGLAIVTLVLHALVVRNDLNFDTCAVHILHSVGQVVVRQIEDTNPQTLLCHLNVAHKLVNVVFVREEEGVHVPWLRTVQILLDLHHMLAQVV